MADELTTTMTLAYSNAGIVITMGGTDKVTIAANLYTRGTVTIATAAGTALDLGAIVTPGFMVIRNMDATNFVSVGNSGDPLPVKIKAGEWAAFRWSAGMTPHAIADTASVLVEYFMISN
jgi:hypothetical protein